MDSRPMPKFWRRRSLVIIAAFSTLLGAGYAGHRLSQWLRPNEADVEVTEQPFTGFDPVPFQDTSVSDHMWNTDDEPVATSEPEEEPAIQYFPEAVGTIPDTQAIPVGEQAAANEEIGGESQEGIVNKVGAETAAETEQPQTFLPEETAEPINDAERHQREQAIKTIRSVLPKATDEEVEIWLDALDGLPTEAIREVLELRTKFSSLITPPIVPAITPKLPVESEAQPKPLENSWSASILALEGSRSVLLSNIANADTFGFRRRRVTFNESSAAVLQTEGSLFGVDSQHSIDITQGGFVETKRSFDLAIDGRGWFQLRAEDGSLCYTRSGSFRAIDGKLAMKRGDRVLVLEPAILSKNNTADITNLRIAAFIEPSMLTPVGDSMFTANEAAGLAKLIEQKSGDVGNVKQGFLERSNVRLQRELRLLKRLNSQIEALQSASN